MSQRTALPTIRFDAALHTIDRATIVQLPREASARLPSRGQVAVRGTVNGREFKTVLEPDGSSGHWMRVDGRLQKGAAARAGHPASFEIQPVKDWPEPNLPKDFEAALQGASKKIQD